MRACVSGRWDWGEGGRGRARGNFGRTAGGAVGSGRTRQTEDGQTEGGGLEDCRAPSSLFPCISDRPPMSRSFGWYSDL